MLMRRTVRDATKTNNSATYRLHAGVCAVPLETRSRTATEEYVVGGVQQLPAHTETASRAAAASNNGVAVSNNRQAEASNNCRADAPNNSAVLSNNGGKTP